MNDCINCYNNGLNKIDQKTDNADIILILPEQYEADSATIINKYNLRGITKYIIWSDSLLNRLTHGGRSVIAFTSKYRNLLFRYDLEGLPDYLFNYLHQATKPIDTLFPDNPNVAQGVNLLNPFYVNKNKIFIINKVLDKVQGYNLLSGKKFLDFSIPDSVIQRTFAYSGIPSSKCKENHDILQRAHISPIEINSLAFESDTIMVVFTNYYFTVEEDSTIKRDNVNIINISNKDIVHVDHFSPGFKNQWDYNRNYWASTRPVYFYNNHFYFYLYSFPDEGQPYDFNVLGAFSPNKNGSLRLDQVNPLKTPTLYSKSTSCMYPVFNQGYFAFPLIDTLYSVAGDQPPIPLNFIPEQVRFKVPDERCNHGIFINAFYITRDYVWVAYSNNAERYETVVRHNRHTGKNLFATKKINITTDISAHFDPVNPDYLLFTLPNRNGMLYRAKMF